MEVFLADRSGLPLHGRCLHARGGVSVVGSGLALSAQLSPRVWRCFQGSYRDGLRRLGLSPRVWRCFRILGALQSNGLVVSTCVEVFLAYDAHNCLLFRCLHVCGGVSDGGLTNPSAVKLSPRVWRCLKTYV